MILKPFADYESVDREDIFIRKINDVKRTIYCKYCKINFQE